MTLERLIVILIILIIYYFRKYRNIFNPPTLFCASLFFSVASTLLISMLDLDRNLRLVYDGVAKVYASGIVAFIFAWTLFPEKKRISLLKNDVIASELLRLFLRRYIKIIAPLVCLLIAICIVLLGNLPLYSMIKGDFVITEINELRNQLPFGLLGILTASRIILALFVASYVNLNYNRLDLSYKHRILLVCYLLFTSLWEGNRQMFLIYFFCFISRNAQDDVDIKFKLPIYKTLIVIALFVAIFLSVQFIRIGSSGVGTVYEIFLYASYALWNLESIIENYEPKYELLYVLSELIPRRFLDTKIRDLRDFIVEPTASVGYFTYWYLDYNVLGVFVGSFLLGIICKYYASKKFENEFFMNVYILLMYICATVSFYSHAITLVFFVAPLLLLMILMVRFNRFQAYNKHLYPLS